ncbi:phage tail-collar fiber domain-containing protein [Pseudomonas gingeri]|uniref:Phage tail protein n=1 Tax=Pseudomonas gingeri TaxID=117681 RepID=A0A7Y7YIA9_9PSED|nr:phage tail protein [Pseudomonas gingeri]NWB30719.1 phage tail protein [Pseudomonas gingeri]NWC36956.1 phage tail protein [Pseudomonas gingeri]
MVNQNSIFGGMLTNVGAAKKTNCDALGVPWQPSHMLIGDANGADPVPSPEQTKLINQVYRAPLNQLYVSPTDANVLVAELVLPPNVGGWWIRELALEDVDGVFSAVANCAPSYKPLLVQGSGRNQVVRMHIVTSNTANIQLKIDPAVVLATREYVETSIIAALNKQDFKHSVQVATTAPIALSGLQTVDGVALSAGARVLVKDQAAGKDNGIYLVASGAWPRAADADTSIEVTPGLFVHVEQGAAGGDSIWQLITDAPITLGTTPLAFEMIAGRTGITAGTYTKLSVDKNGRVIAGTNPTTLAGYGVTDAYSKAEVDSKVAQASSLPVGALIAFPRDAVPPGFLELDGSVQSSATYPDLAAYLGTSFNKGDEGAGNFRLPESRGEFLRGWDHGRGVDAGRLLGSTQLDQLQGFSFPSAQANGSGGVTFDTWLNGSVIASRAPIVTDGVNGTPRVGSETRPRSLSVMWCIKAWNAPVNQGSIDISELAASIAVATPKHYMAGFGMSINAAAPSTTIDVAAGHARVTGNPVTLNATMSGVLQSAGGWVAGSGVNKLDAGARAANTWYHVFVIRKLVGGTGDLLFSTSLAAPFVPTGFEVIRRLWSIKTDSAGSIIPFINVGRRIIWVSPIKDAIGTIPNGSSSATLTLSVPPGVRTMARVDGGFTGGATTMYFRPTDGAAQSISFVTANTAAALVAWGVGPSMNTSDVDFGAFSIEVLTDSASSVVMQLNNGGAGFYSIMSLGYTEL